MFGNICHATSQFSSKGYLYYSGNYPKSASWSRKLRILPAKTMDFCFENAILTPKFYLQTIFMFKK